MPTALSADRVTGDHVTTAGPASESVPTAVTTWSATDRRVSVAARTSPTVLRVFENANPGWTATMNGTKLPKVTLDGWQQGYVLPAGPATAVHLVYGPDRTYRASAARRPDLRAASARRSVLVVDRGRRRSARSRPARARGLGPVAGAVAAGLLAGWWGIGAFAVLGASARCCSRWIGRPRSHRVDSRPAVWAGLSAALYLVPAPCSW